jgi:hypothetical protein
MKTAFVCDAEGRFHPNKRLLALAHHYGFVPKRCQIRRPQTKGKVERAIGYLAGNYWPRVKDFDLSVEELNETVLTWLTEVDKDTLRDFGESRNERFAKEMPYVNPLPAVPFDYRQPEELLVSRESCITYPTNRYSVRSITGFLRWGNFLWQYRRTVASEQGCLSPISLWITR